MRIAVVHSFYGSGQPSGENSVVVDQVEALRGAGHDVKLVARKTDALRDEPLYAVRSAVTVATGRGPDPTPELVAFRPDVVHVHNTFPNWGSTGLRRWSSRVVVTVHNYRPVCSAATLFRDGAACHECLHSPVLPAIRHGCYRGSRLASMPVALGTRPGGPARAMLQEAAAVVVLNEQARDIYAGTLKRAIDVVPNFVEAQPAGPPQPRNGWAYVGRFTQEKGVVDLITRWPGDQHLDVIGTGPAAEQVQAAAADRRAVTVVAHIDRAEVRQRLRSYEGLIVPSLWAEGLPTIILEALSVGTPIVLSSAVAAGEQLARLGVAERYVPAHGEAEITRALSVVRADGHAMSARAEQVHDSLHSPRAWLAGMSAIYQRVARA